jgi:hypothetical protein
MGGARNGKDALGGRTKKSRRENGGQSQHLSGSGLSKDLRGGASRDQLEWVRRLQVWAREPV